MRIECVEGETCFAVVRVPSRKAMEEVWAKLDVGDGDAADAADAIYDAALQGMRAEMGCKKEITTACPPRTLSRHLAARRGSGGGVELSRRLVCFVVSPGSPR